VGNANQVTTRIQPLDLGNITNGIHVPQNRSIFAMKPSRTVTTRYSP
jgi:hypothetical protein